MDVTQYTMKTVAFLNLIFYLKGICQICAYFLVNFPSQSCAVCQEDVNHHVHVAATHMHTYATTLTELGSMLKPCRELTNKR